MINRTCRNRRSGSQAVVAVLVLGLVGGLSTVAPAHAATSPTTPAACSELVDLVAGATGFAPRSPSCWADDHPTGATFEQLAGLVASNAGPA